jgi:electron transfer flavoprotein alpha subunit
LTGQIADIVALEGEDTFTRPIYAGNAILKIKSSPKDKIKIVTVRTTAFEKAAIGSGAAEVEEVKEVSADSECTNLLVNSTDLSSLLPDIYGFYMY